MTSLQWNRRHKAGACQWSTRTVFTVLLGEASLLDSVQSLMSRAVHFWINMLDHIFLEVYFIHCQEPIIPILSLCLDWKSKSDSSNASVQPDVHYPYSQYSSQVKLKYLLALTILISLRLHNALWCFQIYRCTHLFIIHWFTCELLMESIIYWAPKTYWRWAKNQVRLVNKIGRGSFLSWEVCFR